ncbi:uncharacterized protein LOC116687947 [Etheostoma spectabile]|uniref:uncharacterized protein LOC116687947 n=1 Tax=Etheostoma spectabile TaxID=54343 RepID=UPI0013AEB36C|nr:uncharacterized protein LOC116687947 [Etheostoma spectabile]
MVRGQPGRRFPCRHTLTGSELLRLSNQSSPAEVQVTCFYLHVSQSPDSDLSSIIIRTLLPPTLTVSPAVINETDSVTLNCLTPSSVSVSLCYFFTLSGGTVRELSCLQTLTGRELLKTAHQSPPAGVQLTCFYTVKVGEKNYPSPHSDTSSISIHRRTVGTTSTTGTSISTFPPSVNPAAAWSTKEDDLAVSKLPQSSPWEDCWYNKYHWNKYLYFPTVSETSSRTQLPVFLHVVEAKLFQTRIVAEAVVLKCVAAAAGCGVTVGVLLLVSATLCSKRRTAGSEEVKRLEPQNENCDTYHMYSIIAEPAASGLKGRVYSTVQPH